MNKTDIYCYLRTKYPNEVSLIVCSDIVMYNLNAATFITKRIAWQSPVGMSEAEYLGIKSCLNHHIINFTSDSNIHLICCDRTVINNFKGQATTQPGNFRGAPSTEVHMKEIFEAAKKLTEEKNIVTLSYLSLFDLTKHFYDKMGNRSLPLF